MATTTGNVANSDLSRINLNNMGFLGLRFDGLKLAGADLSRANLSGSSIINCDISAHNPGSSNFNGAYIVNMMHPGSAFMATSPFSGSIRT